MSKYHPIDVRYTGPSTAYVGSQPTQFEQQTTASSSQSNPWGAAKQSPEKVIPQKAPKPVRKKRRGTFVGFIFKALLTGLFRKIFWLGAFVWIMASIDKF